MSDVKVHGGGNRLSWDELPPQVRARVEGLAGASVVGHLSAVGGFSPGFAARVTLDDGRTVFVKAISDEINRGGTELFRREAEAFDALPAGVPAPRVLAKADADGWVILVFEYVEGTTPDPSQPDELTSMLRAFESLARDFDPSPVAAGSFEHSWASRFDSWARAANGADRRASLTHPWIAANFDRVVELASGWRSATRGAALLHGDLRADNMILTPAGAIVIVDWPELCIGAPWLDLVLALPSIGMFPEAPDPSDIVRGSTILSSADPARLTTAIAAMTGFFLCASVEPEIPSLPTLRQFQRAQGLVAADWLESRLS